jgi:hypothetical protein
MAIAFIGVVGDFSSPKVGNIGTMPEYGSQGNHAAIKRVLFRKDDINSAWILVISDFD